MPNRLYQIMKHAAYRTPLARFVAPRYIYNFRPAQLCFLAASVERTRDVPGDLLEVGCFSGATTVWLNTHMRDLGIDKQYVALDTFEGFVEEDVAHEVADRGKSADAGMFSRAFAMNHISWVRRTLDLNGFHGVRLVKADASRYDYAQHESVSFALVDVDLYLPVRNALAALWNQMSPGGLIVVDDCKPNNIYDGALEAYREFVADKGLPELIVHDKLGVIEVPR